MDIGTSIECRRTINNARRQFYIHFELLDFSFKVLDSSKLLSKLVWALINFGDLKLEGGILKINRENR